MNIKKLDEDAHWWAKEKVDWAIQDKKGTWWIIPGSEFPEKTIGMKTKNKKVTERTNVNIKFLFVVMLSSFLGVSLAVLLAYLLSR